jgi:hypothetical protein
MINCPKCQVPNPDSANVCAACGTALVGQQFAQALDEAAGAAPTQPAPEAAAPTQPAPEAPAAAAPASIAPAAATAPAPFPMGQAMDPSAAQAEINQFVAEDRARRRTKKLIYFAIFLVIAGVVGFFWWKSHVREQKELQVAEFFQAFRKIDDGQGAAFWQCVVRARDRDVRLAASSDEVTNGLEKAFSNYPKSQPGRIKDKCIPMITGILADLDKLKPPEGFAAPLEDFKTSMKKLRDVFMVYANKIEKRKKEAIVEQEIRNAHKDFHTVMGNGGGLAPVADAPKAVQYYNIMKCVIPDFDKLVRKLTKPPDSQPIVDLYHECKKDPEFANKIRRECYAKRDENIGRSPEFKAAANKMSGDDRDLNAINYCFTKVNHGFAFEELKAIAEVFGKYRNEARANILKAVQKVKEELSE